MTYHDALQRRKEMWELLRKAWNGGESAYTKEFDDALMEYEWAVDIEQRVCAITDDTIALYVRLALDCW